MTAGRDPERPGTVEPAPAGSDPGPVPAAAAAADEDTQPVEVSGEDTQPVEVSARTGPFAPAEHPVAPIPLVSSTAANMLLADALPPTAAPEPAVPDPTSGVDALFAESQFRDYDAVPPSRPAAPPPIAAPAVGPGTPAAEAADITPAQRVLLIVAGALVALVALVALFFVGTRLPHASQPTATARQPTATPSPAATVLPPGPVAVGSHRWDQLLGGECLKEFPGPWAERYTVVDCATPHPAQMVYRGRFPDPATPGYPGAAVLQSQMSVLCSAPGVIDLAAASRYTDAQIQASYPATAAQWDAGDHWYYCFVSRSSKDPLTGSVAVVRTPAPTSTG